MIRLYWKRTKPFDTPEGEGEPSPPLDASPRREDRCREAAKAPPSSGQWEFFCTSLLQRKWGKILYGKCMSNSLESAQMKEGFCGWLEIPYVDPRMI
jgi:hypothetical protein